MRRLRGQSRGESGGAVSLWVVLMVPVSAFAAVVAMAGPQRLAAESSVKEAAGDMATAAVAWRYSHKESGGQIPVFPPDCVRSQSQQDELDGLRIFEADRLNDYNVLNQDPNADPDDVRAADDAHQEAKRIRERYEAKLAAWEQACGLLFDSIVRDLGYLGLDANSMTGFYSDSLAQDPSHLPCKVSQRIRVEDAVHVALVGDWQYAGWAAAQVWPDGMRMGAESIGRRSRAVDDAGSIDECDKKLDVLDDQGRPLTLSFNPATPPPSRVLAESSPERTAFSG